jgi:hypothetical protein
MGAVTWPWFDIYSILKGAVVGPIFKFLSSDSRADFSHLSSASAAKEAATKQPISRQQVLAQARQ